MLVYKDSRSHVWNQESQFLELTLGEEETIVTGVIERQNGPTITGSVIGSHCPEQPGTMIPPDPRESCDERADRA